MPSFLSSPPLLDRRPRSPQRPRPSCRRHSRSSLTTPSFLCCLTAVLFSVQIEKNLDNNNTTVRFEPVFAFSLARRRLGLGGKKKGRKAHSRLLAATHGCPKAAPPPQPPSRSISPVETAAARVFASRLEVRRTSRLAAVPAGGPSSRLVSLCNSARPCLHFLVELVKPVKSLIDSPNDLMTGLVFKTLKIYER
ncbi:hypothetical protein PIB30_033827 [Stylosanthes scabra]|uniref:Uncharacterized protein n=1 Tax=Stylosanthes scabra TaxID=79078 RepID=A0ABU6ZCA4_9FABA|nr:hypothetical protein [Stylosanthes scabra]